MKNAILLFLLLPIFTNGQVTLNGAVTNTESPIAYANIVLTNEAGDFVKGVITNDLGLFNLKLEKGNYTLTASHINHQTIELPLEIVDSLTLETIVLKEAASELGEVMVSASRSIVRKEIDKTVVNIEHSIVGQSGSAFEALQSAPGLVLNNDQIAMIGKSNIRVAVDGRLVPLSGNDLSEFLKSMTASDIKEIEVISNPSAKYEAEGNSGIVNIITKRIKKNTWSNATSATHNQARYGWQTFNNSFNYQKNKYSLLFTTTYQSGAINFKQKVSPNYSTNPQHIDSDQKRNINTLSPRLLLDYRMDDHTTIGLQYLGSFAKPRQLDDLKTTVFNSEREIQYFLLADNTVFDQDRNNSSYNFYFDKKLDTLDRRITFNIDLLDYKGSTATEVVSNQIDTNQKFIATEFSNQGKASNELLNFSAKFDVEHPTTWAKISYGLNTSFSKTDYQLNNFNTISGEPVFNPLQSNIFHFNENIQAAYANIYKKINDKLDFQIGLRSEYTSTTGESEETDIEEAVFKNNYLKFFPTFYLRYTKNERHTFSINYGRRLNRPGYSQLNPARSFFSRQSSQQGNPYLLPSFSDNIELTHSFIPDLSTTLTLRRTTNAYSFLFGLNDETQEQTISYKNLFNENSISIMTSYQFNLTPWWNAQALIFAGYSKSQALSTEDNVALMNGGRAYASVNNRLTLNKSKTITGEINFWYDSPYSASLYHFGQASALDLAIRFKAIAKGMNLTIGVYDVFNSSPRNISSTVNNVSHNFYADTSNRHFRVALSYKFGNEKIKTRARAFGNEEVRGRGQ